ncbi:MAG: CHASE2 domain-containing protein [Bryobacteraceae bacterium]
MKERSARRKFWRYFGVGVCWMAFTSGIHELADRTWLVQRLETANLDALFSGKKRIVSPDVVVVSITDDDYQNVFGGISPLNAGKLMKVIDAILAGNPKALGVDFDTSGWAGPPAKYAGKPIVWAREVLGEAGSLTMGKVLGGTEEVCYGVPAYFPDEDGIVREYKEFIQGADHKYYPSVAFNLVEVSQRGPQACRGALPNLDRNQSSELEKINFRGPKHAFDHLSIGVLRTLENLPASAVHPLHGKIVLLGGAYRAARDAYPTPFSYLDGVDIIANTVDMNLPGNKELKDTPAWLNAVGYLQGVVLLAGLYFVSRTWSLLIQVLVVPVYALLVNWVAFQWAGTFVSFVPCFVGIVIHEMVEHATEYHRLQRENRELHEQMNHLRAAATSASTPFHGEG